MAHKKSSFQANTIILSPFYSQKHKDFFKRKTIFGVIGTFRRHFKGRTIRKVMGGVGKNQKKIHARKNAEKKNSCREEGKEKKFMQKEGPTPGPAILILIINKDI